MRRLIRWLPVLILIPLWGSGLVLALIAERVIVSGVHDKLAVARAAHAHGVRRVLREQERFVQMLTDTAADTLANGVIPTLDVTDLSSHLPETLACAIFDRQGRVIAHSGVPESLLDEMGRGLPEYPMIRITDSTTDASGQASYNLFLPLITPEGAPVIHQTEAWVGSLGCNLSDILSESLSVTHEDLGLSGEAYLVSAKTRRLLTSSRFAPNAIGALTVETEGVRQALKLGRGHAVYPDYRGISVRGEGLYLPEYDWVLLVEIDEAEAVAPLMRLWIAMLASLGLVSIIVWFAEWQYKRRLSDAIDQLHEAKTKAEEAGQRLRTMVDSALSSIVETDERGVIERANPAAQAIRLSELAMLQHLLEGVTHGLKNPLFIVRGRLDLLGEKLGQPMYEAFRNDVAKAVDAVMRLEKALDHFTWVAAARTPERRPCSVQGAFEEAELLLTEDLRRYRIELHSGIAPGLPLVMADPLEFRRIFMTLMVNAVEAMTPRGHGTLTVTAVLAADAENERRGDTERAASGEGEIRGRGEGASHGAWIEIRVQDDGPGIPPEHRARLFEPFFTTKAANGAAGMGLWTLRTIVMALKGTVTYETEVGHGTTFIVRLPAAEEAMRGVATRGRGASDREENYGDHSDCKRGPQVQ